MFRAGGRSSAASVHTCWDCIYEIRVPLVHYIRGCWVETSSPIHIVSEPRSRKAWYVRRLAVGDGILRSILTAVRPRLQNEKNALRLTLHTQCGISRGEATATVSGKETRHTCITPTYQDLPRHVLIGGAGPEVDEQEHEDGGREEKREDAPPTREGPDFSVQDLVSLAGLPVFRPTFILAFHGVTANDIPTGEGGGSVFGVVSSSIVHEKRRGGARIPRETTGRCPLCARSLAATGDERGATGCHTRGGRGRCKPVGSSMDQDSLFFPGA